MEIKKMKSLLRELVLELEEKVPYASAFSGNVRGRNVSVSTYNKRAGFLPPSKGVTFTAFNGKHFFERSTNKLKKTEIHKAAKELLAICKKIGIKKDSELAIESGEKLEKDFYVEIKKDPEKLEFKEMLDEAEKGKNQVQKLSSKIVNCGINFGYAHAEELFVNRSKILYQEINRWDSIFYAVFHDNKKSAQIWGGHSKHGGYEHMVFDEAKIKKTIDDGEKILYAKRIEPGYYDCIFSPEMSGMFAHEAFGHGTETDMYLKKRAKGQEFMQKPVAAPGVNMFDSPALKGEAASYFFDNEGNMASETQIIKDGILVSGITDLNSAMRLNYERTPNGRRENYSHKVYARMTNTYFGTGNDEFEDMVKSIEHGFLVDYATNGMEDPKGWGIQLEALYAREIRNGKLTDNYFTPIIVTGYVPDLLKSITMIGKQIEIAGLGWCGKGYKELVKVTDGGPYMKLKARLA